MARGVTAKPTTSLNPNLDHLIPWSAVDQRNSFARLLTPMVIEVVAHLKPILAGCCNPKLPYNVNPIENHASRTSLWVRVLPSGPASRRPFLNVQASRSTSKHPKLAKKTADFRIRKKKKKKRLVAHPTGFWVSRITPPFELEFYTLNSPQWIPTNLARKNAIHRSHLILIYTEKQKRVSSPGKEESLCTLVSNNSPRIRCQTQVTCTLFLRSS
ncbi:hypothetical protein R3P38DRAFT_1697956 [Favolaschia claudopus]|uniref:Uncharacterized protein n=1 Tax=Favolaschia claudopus TaxID=2862362 RepID=A0AAW0ACM1_9AGAR